jgi:hypothetical protein
LRKQVLNLWSLKQLSRDSKLAVIVVSSFNRENYNSPVSFNSFKESGGIEYTSDFVMGLQLSILDDVKSSEKDRIKLASQLDEAKKGNYEGMRQVSLVILKNRNGISNSIQPMEFYGKNNLFMEIEKEQFKTKEDLEQEEFNKKKQERFKEEKAKENLRKKVEEDLKKKKYTNDVFSAIDTNEIIEKELAELRKNAAIKKAKEEAKRRFELEEVVVEDED